MKNHLSAMLLVGLFAVQARAGGFAEQVKHLDDPQILTTVVKAGGDALADLAEALKGPRPDLAVRAIGQIKSLHATPLLLPLVKAEDGELRANVAWALGECGGTAAAYALGRMVGDPYPPVRAAAVLAIVKLNSAEARLALEHALTDKQETVRLAAVNAVRQRGGNDLFKVLIPLLNYRVDRVPEKKDDAGAKPATPPAKPDPNVKIKLVDEVTWAEPSPQVRLAVIQALTALKIPDALPPLIDAMERAESYNRLAIISGIEGFGKSAAPVCLGRIVPTPYDKEAFAERMPLLINNGTLAVIAGRLGDARCVPYLLKTLTMPRDELGKDKDLTELYIQSVELLGKYKVDRAARPLAELLKQSRIVQLAKVTEESLRQIGRPAARPLASNLDAWEIAPVFLELLREPELRTHAAREGIVKFLGDESDEVRLAATQTLGLYLYEGILDEYDQPLLDAMYLDSNREIRVACAQWQQKILQKTPNEVKP
ncbi:MAG TPA: HEAT repeat domain-containing protein [Tepidisphaeraceae bacterium]